MGERAQRYAQRALLVLAVGTVAVVALTLVPVWPCVLFEHFRVQVAIGGALLTAIAFALASRAADAFVISTLITLIAIVPDLGAQRRAVPAGEHLRLLSINVLMENTRYADVARLIEVERPDVIALVEVDQRWLAGIAAAVAPYARVEAPEDDHTGIAVYARGELRGEIRRLANDMPTLFAELRVRGAAVRMVVVHPMPPISARFHAELVAYFAELGALVRPDPRVIVAGDFNATPWSRPYATMRGASGLCDSRAGFGAQTSFPAGLWLLRIPIDHVLVACPIGVADRRIGPDVGSDHLPVITDLVVPP